jgi:hypothetical protein
MIEQVNIVYTSPRTRRKRTRSVGSSSVSMYDAPQTPVDAYNSLDGGRLGATFSLIKIKKNSSSSRGLNYCSQKENQTSSDEPDNSDNPLQVRYSIIQSPHYTFKSTHRYHLLKSRLPHSPHGWPVPSLLSIAIITCVVCSHHHRHQNLSSHFLCPLLNKKLITYKLSNHQPYPIFKSPKTYTLTRKCKNTIISGYMLLKLSHSPMTPLTCIFQNLSPKPHRYSTLPCPILIPIVYPLI